MDTSKKIRKKNSFKLNKENELVFKPILKYMKNKIKNIVGKTSLIFFKLKT